MIPAALAYREFRWLFAGLLASNFGIWMQQFALGWLVVQIAIEEGAPGLAGFYLGLRSLASAAPALACGLLAGVLADRIDRRDLLVRARIGSALIATALAMLVITDRASLPAVLLLSAASSAAFAFDPPGRQAILPNVVPRAALFSAMALTRASMQLAHTIGPLIAGILVIPVGVGGVLLSKAGMDVASIAALAAMRRQPPAADARASGIFGSLGEGFGHMRGDAVIRWSLLLLSVFAVFAHSTLQLLPAVTAETLRAGAVELSWLVAATGIGSLIGAVFIARSATVKRHGRLLLAAMLSVGLLLVLLGLQTDLLGALLVLVALGCIQQLFMGLQSVILQLAAPDRLRGRVMGIQSVIIMSLAPVGVLAIGTLGTFIGISTAILLAGATVAVVAVLCLLFLVAIRDMRITGLQRPPEEALAPPAEAAE